MGSHLLYDFPLWTTRSFSSEKCNKTELDFSIKFMTSFWYTEMGGVFNRSAVEDMEAWWSICHLEAFQKMLRGLLINDRLFFSFMKEGLVEKEERAKMVGCSQKAVYRKRAWLLAFTRYISEPLKEKKGMVAVNWIIKSSVSMWTS